MASACSALLPRPASLLGRREGSPSSPDLQLPSSRCHCLHFRQSTIEKNVTASMLARLSAIQNIHGVLACAASSVSKIRPAPSAVQFSSLHISALWFLCQSYPPSLPSFIHSVLLSFTLLRIWNSVLPFLKIILSACVLSFILYWRWRQSFRRTPSPMAL